MILPRPIRGGGDMMLQSHARLTRLHMVTRSCGHHPMDPLGCAELIQGPLACRVLFPQHSSDQATPTLQLTTATKAMVPKVGCRGKKE